MFIEKELINCLIFNCKVIIIFFIHSINSDYSKTYIYTIWNNV